MRFVCFVIFALLLFGQSTSVVSALSPAQKKIFQEGINYYDINTCDTSGDSGSTNPVSRDGSLDITDIVKKYDLQSVMIQKVGGGVIAESNSNTPPATPASTMKLIIADTVLQNGINLSQTVNVGRDVYYDGGNDLGKSQVTLDEALQAMLSVSSNVGANVLMKALGGVNAFTQKAQSYGYTHTTVGGYYDPSNDGKNTSTISDEVVAMNHIFSTNGSDYQTAQASLKSAAQNDNHYGVGDIANKWAGTSTVAGNVGLFHINNDDYIIGLYYNGNDSSPESINAIRDGSANLVSAVQTGGDSSTPATDSSGACCSSGSSTTDFGTGTLPDSVPKPYNAIFTAAGNKFDVSPAFIAAIFYGGEHGNSFPDPPPPYGHGAPWATSYAAAQGPFQFLTSTWATYQQDGNGDGKKDIQDLTDAAFGGAKLLAALGAKGTTSESKLRQAAADYNGIGDPGASYPSLVWAAFQKFGGAPSMGSGSAIISSPSSSSCGSSGSPDCQTVSGTAKILCAAKAYAGIYYEYGGGHQGYSAFKSGCSDPSNPPNNQPSGGPVNGDPAGKSGNPSPCGLDCSGLVSVAVDDAFNQSFMWTVAASMQGAGADNWHSVSMGQAQAGDIVTSSGHVEIVDHVSGGTIYTFGAHDTGEKISPDTFPTSFFTGGAWRWSGPQQ